MKRESLSRSINFLRTHDFAAGLWRLADPKISLASFSSMFIGAGAASGSDQPELFLARFDGARHLRPSRSRKTLPGKYLTLIRERTSRYARTTVLRFPEANASWLKGF